MAPSRWAFHAASITSEGAAASSPWAEHGSSVVAVMAHGVAARGGGEAIECHGGAPLELSRLFGLQSPEQATASPSSGVLL